MHQVKNIAYSYEDEAVATRSRMLHDDLASDPARMKRLRRAARAFAAEFDASFA
jgi:hypothetical protein